MKLFSTPGWHLFISKLHNDFLDPIIIEFPTKVVLQLDIILTTEEGPHLWWWS